MDAPTTPRANRDLATVDRKLSRLNEPHIAPITRLVEEIRALHGRPGVPFVDPTLGGVNAQVLFLTEAPARTAGTGSTMLSPDNDDAAAARMWEFYRASGLGRDRCVHWTAVPWFMSDDRKSKKVTRSDIESGLPWLARLIDLLSDLKLVIAMGDTPRQAFTLYLLREDARLMPWLATAHPNSRIRNANPSLWRDLTRAFDVAARITER